ncbi:cytochrome c oxidase subunit II [Mariniluteicoccus endophyticus]
MSLTKRGRRLTGAALFGLAAVALSGCAQAGPGQGHLFGLPEPSTDRAPHIGNLWVGSWIATLAIGILVWGLMGWAFIRYRRRDVDEVPKQTRYNLPLEVMYTIVPFLIIGVLFFWTVKTQNAMYDKSETSAHTVDVVGQKWSWTFNYNEAGVWDAGTIEKTPDLYLPVNKTVTFNLDSPDVIHSFWVPTFYMKLDVIPGRTNSFQVTPNKVGVFAGKCAELCGTYHSAMLFNVHVVPQEEFDAKMGELKAKGQVGKIKGSTGANSLQVAKKEGE